MKLPSWWPTAALIVLVFLGWRWYGWEQRKQGELKQRIKARETVIAELAKQHRTDTLRLVTTRHTTDSILTTDTLIRTEVVTKIIERERTACDALVSTCEQEKQTLRDQIKDLEKRRPSRFGCAAPLTASTKGLGLGVSCGIRF